MIPVVFVPAAPLLLPDVNPRANVEVAAVRVAMRTAVAQLVASDRVLALCAYCDQQPDRTTAVPTWQSWPSTTEQLEPSSVAVARWLLAEVGTSAAHIVSVSGAAPDLAAAASGIMLSPGDGLLVVADGSAGRHEKAPGHIRSGAHEFDDDVARALAHGDAAALRGLYPERAEQVLSCGAPAWLAAGHLVNGHAVRSSELLLTADPHHVAYFVATWQVDPH